MMKQIIGLSILLPIITLLAQAAALEPANQTGAIIKRLDQFPIEARANIISLGFHGITEFLMHHRAYKNRFMLPAPHEDVTFNLNHNNRLIMFAYDLSMIEQIPGIVIWDLLKRKARHRIKIDFSYFREMLVTPNGNKIITRDNGNRLTAWNTDSGKQSHDLWSGDSIGLSPDGSKLIAVVRRYLTTIWDINTGSKISDIYDEELSDAWAIAISSDGQRAATIKSEGNMVHIWDLTTHQKLFSLPHDDCKILQLQFNNDGTQLIVDSDTSLIVNAATPTVKSHSLRRYIWSMANGEQLSKNDYKEYKADVGNKRIELSGETHPYSLNVYDKATGQLLLAHCKSGPYEYHNNKWLVDTPQYISQKVPVWDMDKLTPAVNMFPFGLVSWRQIVLLGSIAQAFKKEKKLLLDGDNPALAGKIEDFALLPPPIKSIARRYVSFGEWS